ncbi:MAG: hypothetical protein JJD97_08525, partial [Gemmatimonadaceae bacterium]|nr:hypothetical protein [Gemmatimonadaceae bacterium]
MSTRSRTPSSFLSDALCATTRASAFARSLAGDAEPAADLEAVDARQPDVDHGEDGMVLGDQFQGALPRGRQQRAITGVAEIE